MSVYGLLKELRSAASAQGPLVVTGAPDLADELREALARGARPGAVQPHGLAGASALVHVLTGPPTDEDERVLKQARRERVPIVCVVVGRELDTSVPYVLPTDVVRAFDGAPLPVDQTARALAHRLGEDGASLAARLPTLREAVCDRLIASFSRKAGLIGTAVFIPGADLPAITLTQLRLVLRIGAAHGVEIDRERLPEVLAVIGSGLAFRAAARQALGFVPVAGWVVKGAIAYLGTRALGEAAVRYFAGRTDGNGAVRPGS
jgi:uncharacterized protein (DUF697 family)